MKNQALLMTSYAVAETNAASFIGSPVARNAKSRRDGRSMDECET
jgi:hypothetical protein